MNTSGSIKTDLSNAQSLGAREGQKVVLNIFEAREQDKIHARSQGIIINSEFKIIDANNLPNSRRDYLKVNTIGTEDLSEKFDPSNTFELDKDAKSEDQAKNIASDQSLSIVREDDKPNANGINSNLSTNMTDDKILTKSTAQQDDYKLELVAIDDGFNDFTIITKMVKNKESPKMEIIESPIKNYQTSKLNTRKNTEVSNIKASQNSTPQPKNKKKKFIVAKKSTVAKNDNKTVQSEKNLNYGLSYLASVIKGVVIFKKVNKYNEIAAEVCNFILPEKRDVRIIQKQKGKDTPTKNIFRRVYDAINILIGACILEKTNRSVFFSETHFGKERYLARLCDTKAPYNKLKYKRLELIGMMKKYTIIRHLIQRNRSEPSGPRIYLPFVTIGRCADKGGYIKAEATEDGSKAHIESEINLKMHGDLQSMMIFKACRPIPDHSYNAYMREIIERIHQKFDYVPEYLKYPIPK